MTVAIDLDGMPPSLTVPGLHGLLGLPRRRATSTPAEDFDTFCSRISRGAAARYRIHIAADGSVTEATR